MAPNDSKRGSAPEGTARQSESKLMDLVAGANVPGGTPVAPRISAYYSDARVKPAAFVNSVRAAKIKSFKAEDIAEAAQRLSETVRRLPEQSRSWAREQTRSRGGLLTLRR